MKKKVFALVLCVALLAVAIASGTLAYFTDTDARTNVLTVGDVSAVLYESRYHRGATGSSYLKMSGQPEPLTDADIVADDEVYADYLEEAVLMPFDLKKDHQVQSLFEECTVAKNAYVENTGSNDCFVRVRYIIPADIAQYLDIYYVGTQFIKADSEIAKADARTLDNEDSSEPMITNVNTKGANVTLQAALVDGSYVAEFIYAERLTPGEFTLYSPISKITMVPSVTEEIVQQLQLNNRQFSIEVEVDVIQADGFLNALEAFEAWEVPQA